VTEPFALVVRFDLEPTGAAAFDLLVAETLPLIARHEPGTLQYACHAVAGEPLARVFYERYANRSAFAEHERQPHVRRFLDERASCLATPPRVELLGPAAAGGPG
jgi:quinol monooxygenase YgiN